MPWVPPLMVDPLEAEAVPEGLPEIPPILLEADGETEGAMPVGVDRLDSTVVASTSAVWLAGCDPRTLLMGWEESSASRSPADTLVPAPTEWRLRSATEPETVLAGGALPEDRRFLFVQDPPPAPAHVVEVGTRSPEGHWECLASSAPVSLPTSAGNSAPIRAAVPFMQESGVRPGVDSSHFEKILSPAGISTEPAGSSEIGLRLSSGRSVTGGLPGSGPSSESVSWGPALDSTALPSGGGGLRSGAAVDDFWFRVNAEVVLFGSTRPGARVTIFGRPVELRPDGSFTFRCALPDGRFEVPMRAIHPQGSDVREATVTLARQTRAWGGVGSHPGTEGLPLPDSIP